MVQRVNVDKLGVKNAKTFQAYASIGGQRQKTNEHSKNLRGLFEEMSVGSTGGKV